MTPCLPSRKSSHAQHSSPFGPTAIACKPSAAEAGESLTTLGPCHVLPPSVERKATWSPSPPLNLLPLAMMQINPLAAAIRGPRRMPRDIELIVWGNAVGLLNDFPALSDRQ